MWNMATRCVISVTYYGTDKYYDDVFFTMDLVLVHCMDTSSYVIKVTKGAELITLKYAEPGNEIASFPGLGHFSYMKVVQLKESRAWERG